MFLRFLYSSQTLVCCRYTLLALVPSPAPLPDKENEAEGGYGYTKASLAIVLRVSLAVSQWCEGEMIAQLFHRKILSRVLSTVCNTILNIRIIIWGIWYCIN